MKKTIYCFILLLLFAFAGSADATPVNPGFEDPGFLTGWNYSGIVSQVSSGTVSFSGYSYDIAATEGDSMALLSAPGLTGGGDYSDNWISQTITDFQGGKIAFDYNMFSTDWNGNDRFALMIDAENDLYDFYWEMDELTGTPEPIVPFEFYYSGWQHFSHDLGGYKGSLTLRFHAGNGVDDHWNTWTYLDNFTSQPVPEPATVGLLCLSFSCLLGWSIKRKAKG
jgi:hypothetical protein